MSLIWLLKDGEPLPIDGDGRLLRTGRLARELSAAGHQVTWWTSRFDHAKKRQRVHDSAVVEVTVGYTVHLLEAPSYRRNLSFARLWSYRRLADSFRRAAADQPRPAAIVAAYPSPELCVAAQHFARESGIAFVLDVRDPWPDNIAEFFPRVIRPLLTPGTSYYRSVLRRLLKGSDAIVSSNQTLLEWALAHVPGLTTRAEAIYIGGMIPSLDRSESVPPEFTSDRPLRLTFLSSGGISSDALTVVRAAASLNGMGEQRVQFVISGADPVDSAWRREASLLPNVRATGWLDHSDVERELSQSHVGIISLSGGLTRYYLGNKFFDYLSFGLAILNNVPGEPTSLVNECGVGVSVAPRDPAAMARAVRDLLSDPHRVQQCMANARAVFRTRFLNSTSNERYVALIEDVARRSDMPQVTAS